jgi:hypothetical protein
MSIFPTRVLLATDGSKDAELATTTAVDLASFWCEMGEQMPVVVCSPICFGLWSASSITEPPMFEL